MKIIAGIDGGGTQTRLALVREDGVLLSFAEGPSCSFVEYGLEQAREELARLWRAAWQKSAEPVRVVDALFMGMGSILSPGDARINCELVESLRFVRPGGARAENDAFCAYAGGLGGRPGILLIAGTGSACFGRNARGESWRVGGWGHQLHDVGSAHALGVAAMLAATRATDGREQPTALAAMVLEALGINTMAEIYRRVNDDKLDRADIAAFATRVVAIAGDGDGVAKRILSENADGLVEMVETVARRLQLPQPELVLTGGLITQAIEFRKIFLERLEHALPGFKLAQNGFPPVLGAVVLAREQLDPRPVPVEFIQCLRDSAAKTSLIL
jgi:N-acetylglucosamine kinase-like BadF-type ATPase